MNGLLNVSSSPHVRSRLTTGSVMFDVVLALMPATLFGVWFFGLHAFLVIATAVLTSVMTEFIFDYIAHRPNSLTDGSAVVTGLLLGLVLPPSVPLYVPYLGALFAILFVKCAFGGLGQNFMNPALAGRCFLLLSFGTVMTNYAVDGVSSATPLAQMGSGSVVSVTDLFLGFNSGVIGLSGAALLVGGIFLLINGTITWHIPVSYIGSFVVCMILGGGHGFDPMFLIAHICGGGILMGALFMATDPVTSPMTGRGMAIYGVLVGFLTAIFRIYGNAPDSVSYAIILGNLCVPLIDLISIPKPFGVGDNQKKPKPKIPKAAATLAIITLIAGVALAVVNFVTAPIIEQQKLAANAASYVEVMPGADSVGYDSAVTAAVEASAEAYGKSTINEAVVGYDASGAPVGYAVSVTNGEGFDGNIVFSVGFDTEGTITGLQFTEINETAGMGMRADEPEWKAQFAGIPAETITLNDQIDQVSGATFTSKAVTNGVNAAIDFYNNNLK